MLIRLDSMDAPKETRADIEKQIEELKGRLFKLENQPDRHAGRGEGKMNEMDIQLVKALLEEAEEKLRWL